MSDLSPFAYFCREEWPFFVFAVMVYIIVWTLSGYKSFMNW